MLYSYWIVEPDSLDTDHVIADLDAIRQYNPQRFEMEQLTAVVYEDTSHHICVGYKDLTAGEFWIRGHMPQMPVMPPTLMCDAAMQLANYYARKHQLYTTVGCFLGLEGLRCRGIARPGERLIVMAQLLRSHGTLLTCRFQCAVRGRLICDGVFTGGTLPWRKGQRQHGGDRVTERGTIGC